MDDKEFLEKIRKYIESTQENYNNQDLEECIKADQMPVIYEEILVRINNLDS